MNARKLRGKIIECATTQGNLANAIGIDKSTFSRKINNGTFTVGEAKVIADELVLSDVEAIEIFFGKEVAKTQLA